MATLYATTDGAGWYIFRECWLLFEDGFESGDTSAWSRRCRSDKMTRWVHWASFGTPFNDQHVFHTFST